MSESVRLRPATGDDAPGIATAYRAARKAAFDGHLPVEAVLPRSLEEDVARFRDLATGTAGVLLVAEGESGILGLSSVERAEGPGELGALYIHPDSTGRGVGTLLLAGSLAVVRDWRQPEAIAWVLAANRAAKRFFLARGGWLDGAVDIRRSDAGRWVLQRVRFRSDRGASGVH